MKDYVFLDSATQENRAHIFTGEDGKLYGLYTDYEGRPVVQDTQGTVYVWSAQARDGGDDEDDDFELIGSPVPRTFESLPLDWSASTFEIMGGVDMDAEEPEAAPAEALAEATAKQKKKEKKTKMAATKRTRGARAKGAIKNTGKHAMHAASGALQAAAAVKVTDLLIQKLVEQVGPKAPGFAEFAGTPMGRAVLSIGIPALIRTGVEMYREGREDETGEVSAWLNRAQAIADLSFGSNIGKVSVDALGALWSAGAEFLPLIMQATGEAPTMPHQLGAPTITMDAPPTGARTRAKAGGEE